MDYGEALGVKSRHWKSNLVESNYLRWLKFRDNFIIDMNSGASGSNFLAVTFDWKIWMETEK